MFVLTLLRSMLWWARPLPEGRDKGGGRGGVWTGEREHRRRGLRGYGQRGGKGSGAGLSPYNAESS